MKNKQMKLGSIPYLLCMVFIWSVSLRMAHASSGRVFNHLNLKQITSLDGLPSDEVQKVFQDRDGMMWFATRNGLCKYDGYLITTFKSNLYTPDLFTDNNILCLANDSDHNIWIGTQRGLDVLNKETGAIRKGVFPEMENVIISCLLTSRDGLLWIGSDYGLYSYDKETGTLTHYNSEKTDNILSTYPIKSLFQDSEGDIWIGTWSDGLYRYSVLDGIFYKYPKMNSRNSAHCIYEDSQHNIWVGGWDEGVFLLKDAKDMERVSWVNFRHSPNDCSTLSDNIVYDICEDINTNTLWVGTRGGLSILSSASAGKFTNYKPGKSVHYIPSDEINSLHRDNQGNIWIGSIGGGVFMSDTRASQFNMYRFEGDSDIPASAIRAMLVDDDTVWLGIGTYGVAKHDRKSNQYTFFSRIPEFSEITAMPTVYSITQRKQSGEIWLGTYDGGVYAYKKGEKVKHYTVENSDFMKHICVTVLFEDRKGNCWVGTRSGVGVKRADGTGYLLNNIIVDGSNLEWSYVRDIKEDANDDIWIATSNAGLIRVSGNINNPENLRFANYNVTNGKISARNIISLYKDSRGRVWAGTEGHGLYLYNREQDTFECKSLVYNLPGDMVGSIEEDHNGNLWIGTNYGLIRLAVNEPEGPSALRVYTSADGLQDNFFIARSSFNKEGELFFGGYKGYNSFFPDKLDSITAEAPFYITDIKVFNRSFSNLDARLRERISDKTPSFTERIELPYKYNNFSIEFASLTYQNPGLNKYVYKLEGFEKEWQYTDANRHFAYYNNLKSGSYTFLLRATNENGVWSSRTRRMEVVILPPFWATWWAYTIYVLLLIGIVFLIYRTAKNRMILMNSLQLQKLEQGKAEELNHSKLQFFTNITHELLTPLTIISATIDELKLQAPQYVSIYSVLSTNVQRLIRLLQQILEFRKAETGNLKLRVSPGDLAIFVKSEAEAFIPLIKKHKLHFSCMCDPESITGYFDSDKLDKILYNLLSNAAKYNKTGGFIQLSLSYADNKDYVLLSIKDNGKGITKENQKTLFTRFYEGDYRKFNTIGTGIGLSLTKDLVELHGGEISVESEPDKGTTFFVKLPIERSYYKEEQIDEEVIQIQQIDLGVEASEPEQAKASEAKPHTILVLEDNEELLQLMLQLLGREYNVLTAENGREGVVIIENEDIDLIVSDVMMPEMDGIEFCNYVKGKLEFSHIPLILLTAKNKEEDRAKAYESGADAFISKPFNLTVLHARIRNLLKSKERMARDFKNQLVFEVKDLNYTSIDEEFIQRAIQCVNTHLDDPDFDQPQFIEEMRTSKSTLYKKLKSLTGLNTSAFIRNIRLKAACRIMEEKNGIRVSELAYAVGFNDPKYFSSCFKKEFDMLPSEYMERFIPASGNKE